MTSKARSAAWRARRRTGAILISIDVLPAHRRALESMGLIEPGKDQDPGELVWAVERFLDIAPAVQGIGDALYQKVPEFASANGTNAEGDNADTMLPAGSAEHA